MTAAHAHPSWSLPYRLHPKQPTDPAAQMEWAVEQLVEFYTMTDDATLLDALFVFCQGRLSWSEFWERVETLCSLSGDVADLRDNSAGRWAAYDALVDEYASALAALVATPVTA